MPSQTVTVVERTASGAKSRAKLPRFTAPRIEEVAAREYAQCRTLLAAIEDPDERLDTAVKMLDRIQTQLETARAKRDRLVHSLYYFENARGPGFEGAAGLSHVQMDRVKLKALGSQRRPNIEGTKKIDREAARSMAIARGLSHDPDAAKKLPKAAEVVAGLEAQEKAVLEVRDGYVREALRSGVARAVIAERIKRIPSQVTRMARRLEQEEAQSVPA